MACPCYACSGRARSWELSESEFKGLKGSRDEAHRAWAAMALTISHTRSMDQKKSYLLEPTILRYGSFIKATLSVALISSTPLSLGLAANTSHFRELRPCIYHSISSNISISRTQVLSPTPSAQDNRGAPRFLVKWLSSASVGKISPVQRQGLQ